MKTLLIFILLGAVAFNSGSLWAEGDRDPAAEEKVLPAADVSKDKDAEVYSCPMHPEVRQDKEGKCPMCGMDLEKVVDQEDSENKQDPEGPPSASNRELSVSSHNEKRVNFSES